MPVVHQDYELPEELIRVTSRVHTALGMAMSNVSMVEGKDGVIIIDTGTGTAESEAVAAAFRKITDKPVAAVVFTHSHPDHVGGIRAFVKEGDSVPIWAAENFGSENSGLAGLEKIAALRGARQFGLDLPEERKRVASALPARFSRRSSMSPGLPPTHTFSGEKELEISGVKLLLRACPGETNDQICVWLPEDKVLFTGDTMYRSFPNLYAVRGTPYRDIRRWADSLDMMLGFNAEYAVFGHSAPALGAAEVRTMLADYRDAIRFVYDKTVEGMNLGLTPEELGEYVKLPAHLAEKEYLAEFYGCAEWAARALFAGLLGWFGGNPLDLAPLRPKEEAERLAALAGGEKALLEAAEKAAAGADWRWAGRLADALLRLDSKNRQAEDILIQALDALADGILPIATRNYVASCAEERRAKKIA